MQIENINHFLTRKKNCNETQYLQLQPPRFSAFDYCDEFLFFRISRIKRCRIETHSQGSGSTNRPHKPERIYHPFKEGIRKPDGAKIVFEGAHFFKMAQRKIRRELKNNPDAGDKLTSMPLNLGTLSSPFFLSTGILLVLALGFAATMKFSGGRVLKKMKSKPERRSSAREKSDFDGCLAYFLLMIFLVIIVIFLAAFGVITLLPFS